MSRARAGSPREDERGIALVMALMVLLAISLLSVALMMTLQIEKKLTGEQSRYARCLNLAEAGVAEAMSHIRNGDIPSNAANPRLCTQIFLAPAGSLPNYVNTDSIPLPTGQPAGSQLTYSTAGKSGDALTVNYKTDPAQTVVYRYDNTKNPPINYQTGFPIYVIKSTGRVGTTSRRVQAEVIQKPVNLAIRGAMAVNAGIDFGGNAQVCGYNHRGDTPLQTAGVHLGVPGTCLSGGWETGSGDLYGSWSSSNVTSGGSAGQAGTPLPADCRPASMPGVGSRRSFAGRLLLVGRRAAHHHALAHEGHLLHGQQLHYPGCDRRLVGRRWQRRGPALRGRRSHDQQQLHLQGTRLRRRRPQDQR
jgi:Tfp pilus assembly protein PilX